MRFTDRELTMNKTKTVSIICLIIFATIVIVGKLIDIFYPSFSGATFLVSIGFIGVGVSVVMISVIYLLINKKRH